MDHKHDSWWGLFSWLRPVCVDVHLQLEFSGFGFPRLTRKVTRSKLNEDQPRSRLVAGIKHILVGCAMQNPCSAVCFSVSFSPCASALFNVSTLLLTVLFCET